MKTGLQPGDVVVCASLPGKRKARGIVLRTFRAENLVLMGQNHGPIDAAEVRFWRNNHILPIASLLKVGDTKRRNALHEFGRKLTRLTGTGAAAAFLGPKAALITNRLIATFQSFRRENATHKNQDKNKNSMNIILTILKSALRVGPAINTLFQDKKTNIFNIVVAYLTVFNPELLEHLINGARTLSETPEVFTMDPQTRSLIVLLNMTNLVLRNWSTIWGSKKEKPSVVATPVDVSPDYQDFRTTSQD